MCPRGACSGFAPRRGDYRSRSVGHNRRRRYLRCVCFFFQAEDGIRDVAVTGVQTCALPISFVLLILASAALPVVRVTIVRSKEAQLHKALREIRNAIDRYKDYGDLHLIRVEVGNEGYPPDLDTLVKPVQIGANRKVRFLRRIPVDPMTGRADWNLQSIQDDADSTSWGGSNVFDVHSKSQGTALDGTHYAEW